MTDFAYFKEMPMAVTVCDSEGIILYMNDKSAATFQKDGGIDLIGRSLFDCHPGASKEKLRRLLNNSTPNTYTIEKKGVHKMVYQTPWFENGESRGFIEFSFEIPTDIPHFIRS
jgi:transcriptional regulator with PAS, ATPase and Fis domain